MPGGFAGLHGETGYRSTGAACRAEATANQVVYRVHLWRLCYSDDIIRMGHR